MFSAMDGERQSVTYFLGGATVSPTVFLAYELSEVLVGEPIVHRLKFGCLL